MIPILVSKMKFKYDKLYFRLMKNNNLTLVTFCAFNSCCCKFIPFGLCTRKYD